MELRDLADAIIEGDEVKAEEYTQMAIDEGVPAEEILNKGMIAGMGVVGKKFKDGEIFVPEVLVSAEAMKLGMRVLKPVLISSNVKLKGEVIMGTVEGDLHDIGKNLVLMMLEGAGYQVHDLGSDVPAEKFVKEAKIHRPDVIGLSALLTTTMLNMEGVIEKLRENGIDVKVIIGGAPITQEYASKIGAFYAEDAQQAVEKIDELIS